LIIVDFRLSGTIPNEMMNMNPNIMLNFTDNQYVLKMYSRLGDNAKCYVA